MAGITFSGLASGIDFDALVTALIEIERRPIAQMRARQSEGREDIGALTDVKNRLTNLRDKSMVFTSPLDTVFKKIRAVSSNEGVVRVSAQSTASAGSYDVRVERLARSMTVISKAVPAVSSFTAGATGADLNADIEAGVTRLGSLHRRSDGVNLAAADLGAFTVDDGSNGVTVDLSALGTGSTVQDLLDAANAQLAAGGSSATVSLNADSTGLLVSSGTGNLSIADADAAATATKLGLATAGTVAGPVDGGDLDPDLQADTSLAALRGGAGVSTAGGFTIRLGTSSATVDVSAATTLQDVVDAIQATGLAVAASIGADGIRLDATAADKSLAVDEGGGLAGADLGLAGLESGVLRVKTAADADFTRVLLDGVSATAIRDAFNRPTGRSWAASVVDGRLVLNATTLGTDGALSFRDDRLDGGVLEQLEILETNPADDATLSTAYATDSSRGGVVAQGQNARFSVNGIVVERSANTGISDVVSGVTFDLVGASAATGPSFPADYAQTTVTVSADDDAVVSAVRDLVAQYNSAMATVRDVTRIDTQGDADGTLVNNSLLRAAKVDVESVLIDPNRDVGQVAPALFQLVDPEGKPVFELQRDGTLTFDEGRLRAALAEDRGAVEEVFALDTDGNGTFDDGVAVRLKNLLDGYVNFGGLLETETDTVEFLIDDLEDRILDLEEMLDLREKTLRAQFTAAERAISQLQATSNAISNQNAFTSAQKKTTAKK